MKPEAVYSQTSPELVEAKGIVPYNLTAENVSDKKILARIIIRLGHLGLLGADMMHSDVSDKLLKDLGMSGDSPFTVRRQPAVRRIMQGLVEAAKPSDDPFSHRVKETLREYKQALLQGSLDEYRLRHENEPKLWYYEYAYQGKEMDWDIKCHLILCHTNPAPYFEAKRRRRISSRDDWRTHMNNQEGLDIMRDSEVTFIPISNNDRVYSSEYRSPYYYEQYGLEIAPNTEPTVLTALPTCTESIIELAV